MKTIVIIATFAACCFAASALNLQHPSPINPSVLVEVKPQEEAVLFTDPLEIAKVKREVPQPLYSTILPEDHPHHLAKRNELKPEYYLTRLHRQQKTASTTERNEEKSDEDSKEDTNVKADKVGEEEKDYDTCCFVG